MCAILSTGPFEAFASYVRAFRARDHVERGHCGNDAGVRGASLHLQIYNKASLGKLCSVARPPSSVLVYQDVQEAPRCCYSRCLCCGPRYLPGAVDQWRRPGQLLRPTPSEQLTRD